MSNKQKANKRSGILFCLIGPAAGGKSTFAEELVKAYGSSVSLSVSATSRLPRSNEVNGKSYLFISRGEFKERVEKNEFFEWEEIHGNLYGTFKKSVIDAIETGVDLILDVDIRGALNFKRHYPQHSVVVFVVPPSFETLRDRLTKRGGASEEEIQTRLQTAEQEYHMLKSLIELPGKVDYFVINDSKDEAFRCISGILEAERVRFGRIDPKLIDAVCQIK